MADNTKNESITEVVSKVLGKYLVSEVSDFRDYYAEFPQKNRSFKMPSVSVIVSTDSFRALTPYPKTQLEAADIENNKASYEWVVGIYDFAIQVDIWAKNKESRDDLFDATFNALNPEITPMGLRLKMKEYFDQLIEFSLIGQEFGDSEAASQTDEWRVTLRLLATCKAVRTRREFIITDTPTPAEIENASGLVDGEEEHSEINPHVLVVSD